MSSNLKLSRFFRPVLEVLKDGTSRTRAEIALEVVDELKLSPEDASQLTTKGDKTKVHDRVHWAAYFLSRAGLLLLANRKFAITDRGRHFLGEHPESISKDDLLRFDEFRDFLGRTRRKSGRSDSDDVDEAVETQSFIDSNLTPTDQIEQAQQQINEEVCTELLERIKAKSPAFFEHLVIELLVKMGYGGTFTDAASVVGRSGDGGIDGVIKEDRLGLDKIYVQAKRWQGKVGEPEVRNFVGSLAGRGATKGVFITTSSYQDNVIIYLQRVQATIVLVDGEELAKLCLEHDLGVSLSKTIHIKKIDSDYFE